MRANNLTLLTDLYELTMMQGYFKNSTDQTVVFDMFYRDNPCGGGFAICAGLEQVIEYIENLRFTDADIEYLRGLSIFEEDFLEYLRSFHFTGDIYAIPEGHKQSIFQVSVHTQTSHFPMIQKAPSARSRP